MASNKDKPEPHIAEQITGSEASKDALESAKGSPAEEKGNALTANHPDLRTHELVSSFGSNVVVPGRRTVLGEVKAKRKLRTTQMTSFPPLRQVHLQGGQEAPKYGLSKKSKQRRAHAYHQRGQSQRTEASSFRLSRPNPHSRAVSSTVIQLGLQKKPARMRGLRRAQRFVEPPPLSPSLVQDVEISLQLGSLDGSGESSQQGSDAVDVADPESQAGEHGSNFVSWADLAVATPISDQPPEDLPIAEEWFAQEQGEQRRVPASKVWLILNRLLVGGAVLIVATAMVVLVVIFTTGGKDSANVDKSAGRQHGQSPKEWMLSLLPDFSLNELEDTDSPQSKAFQWVIGDPKFDTYPPSRVVQRFSLATVYYSTGGSSAGGWIMNGKWMSYENHECDWSAGNSSEVLKTFNTSDYGGKVCAGSESEEYQYLLLSCNRLEGSLPPELYLLTSLKLLDVTSNKLRGTISSHIARLSNLTALSLANNEYSGSIPSEIGLLSTIQGLLLFSNQITGSVPSEMGQLHEMQFLVLDGNMLSGSIPSEIGLMKSLITLTLQKNSLAGLTGAIPTELGQLNHIKRIHLDHNQLGGALPSELGLLEHLEFLYLEHNQLKGMIPLKLWELHRLKVMWVHDNFFTGSLASQMGKLEQLLELSLGDNAFSGTLPREIGNMQRLSGFGLWNTPLVTGSLPTELAGLRNLSALGFWNTKIGGPLPTEIGQLFMLNTLILSQNLLTGSIPSELGSLSSLVVGLSLFGNMLTGTIPIQLASLSSFYMGITGLLILQLNQNHLSGPIPSELGKLDFLEFLDLSSNRLSSMIPSEIGLAQSLLELRLDNNELTGRLSTTLSLLPFSGFSLFTMGVTAIENYGHGLQVSEAIADTALPTWSLLLGKNNFTGKIPSEFGMLTKLRTLSLPENALTGPLPPQLGGLSRLASFNVANNAFTGSVPSALAAWVGPALDNFNISNNQLSGIVPLDFCALDDSVFAFACSETLCGCNCEC